MENEIYDGKLPTIREIQQKIPNHLFFPHRMKAILLFTQTILLCAMLFAFAIYVIPSSPTPLKEILWILYWFMQGTMFWSFFGWGHDCGHGGFSKYKWVNTVVGNLVHSAILMPYESWRVTHQIHHRNTGNIDKDINYPPKRDHSEVRKHRFMGLLGISHFLYLMGFSTSRINHFNPFEAVYSKVRARILASLLCWLIFFSLIVYAIFVFGFQTVMALYGMPLYGYATWLVISSFLNHVDPKVPWWGNESWSYMKGNIFSVIDVSYGKFLDYLVQDNGYHQIHHLFPHLPTYHMKEATKHLRNNFPHLTKNRDMNIVSAYWHYLGNFINQPELSDDVDVVYYDRKPSQK